MTSSNALKCVVSDYRKISYRRLCYASFKEGERVKKEQKDNIESLMYHMVKNNYKEICDKIKVAILEKLIEISLTKPKGKECITFYELEAIKSGIDELRTKDREAETKAIVSVIDNLISRGDNNINNQVTKK
jgi:hypothetical protein